MKEDIYISTYTAKNKFTAYGAFISSVDDNDESLNLCGVVNSSLGWTEGSYMNAFLLALTNALDHVKAEGNVRLLIIVPITKSGESNRKAIMANLDKFRQVVVYHKSFDAVFPITTTNRELKKQIADKLFNIKFAATRLEIKYKGKPINENPWRELVDAMFTQIHEDTDEPENPV